MEDIPSATVVACCYHTISGYCPGCRKRVESRVPEQPQAVDPPHGQIGINALTTAALLRKITGGSRSERGARATAILMSVLRTARQSRRAGI